MKIAKPVFAMILTLFLWGCSSKPPVLEGAVNPDKIPVYARSALDPKQALAGSESESTYSKYWDLTYTDPQEKVVAFYQQAMPQAKMEKKDDGATEFFWKFPGAEEGEYIEIRVEKDVIHTVECLRFGKHKR